MHINFVEWKTLSAPERTRFLRRSEEDIARVRDGVEHIISRVEAEGDSALRAFTLEFDRVDLGEKPLSVTEEEKQAAISSLDDQLRAAIEFAVENVQTYHRTQLPHGINMVEVRPGVYAGERATAVPSAGLYVPRGRGSFPSMLYMLAVPAKVAGCEHVCVVTPPGDGGSVDPACLYAAQLCGVTDIYRIGGAQAIAALAYGTESVPAVAKIVGPGSAYVAAAKRLVSHRVDTGLPAGPTESIVIADGSADPWKVALDLMIEAEHGSDSSALLITPSRAVASSVQEIIPDLAADIPEPRRAFLTDVFAGYGGIILTGTIEEAAALSNSFAPEHLQIQTAEPYQTLSLITHAGEILLGEHSAFSLANYAAGANAVLPTGGGARTYSPVSVRDFMKHSSVVHITDEGYQTMKDHVIRLADYEGFPAHAAALRRRNESV